MDNKLYEQFEEIHTKHWWFRGRLKILETVLRKYVPKGSYPLEILDVGCGTGSYFPILESFGRVSGVEANMEAIKNLRERGVMNDVFHDNLVAMRLGRQFNCITAFEIMEHIEDDDALLRNLGSHLCDGGLLVGTVPAYKWLWSPHDDLAHHRRRYTRGDLVRKLTSAGFRIKWISYYNTLLFPLAVLVRFLKKTWLGNLLPVSDFSLGGGVMSRVLENIFALERYWLTRFRFPFGFSLIFVAVKEQEDTYV